MKNKKLKLLLISAAASAITLAGVCAAIFITDNGSEFEWSNAEFEMVQNPLRMIVYAAEFPEPSPEYTQSVMPQETTEPDLDASDAKIEAKLNGTGTVAGISVKGLSKAEKMRLAVWSEAGGQDDIVWYDMSRDSDGTFKVDIPIKNHHTEGNYKADAYVVKSDDSKYSIGTTSFKVEGPKLQSASFENINQNAGTFQVKIEKAASVSTAKKAKVKVYPADSPNNSKVYETELSADGNGTVECNVSNHAYLSGKYKAEVYIIDGNEIEKNLSQITTDITLPQTVISQTAIEQGLKVKLNVSGLIENSVSSLYFDVYSKSNGKDDLVSYPATATSASSFEATAVISNHHTAGEYQVDVYAVRNGKNKELIGNTTFTVAAPVAGNLTVSEKKEDDEYFKVALSQASSASGISQVRFKVVRSSDNKEDWYNASCSAAGSSDITVDTKGQSESTDTYTVTAYVKDANGIEAATSPVEVVMTLLNNGKYKIMGTTRTSVSQMVKYFNANASYPSYYANSDAPTIEAFCQIFYDEAAAEGVRAEVAFCQTMKETGYLKFGGDVSISQYNFAGIGATGNGACGNSFGSVREGIRAQIQHLKAYASSDGLKNACVDPRFSYVKRASAIYVEWLGIKENPYGGGWAASEGYGTSIVNSYIRKLFSY